MLIYSCNCTTECHKLRRKWQDQRFSSGSKHAPFLSFSNASLPPSSPPPFPLRRENPELFSDSVISPLTFNNGIFLVYPYLVYLLFFYSFSFSLFSKSGSEVFKRIFVTLIPWGNFQPWNSIFFSISISTKELTNLNKMKEKGKERREEGTRKTSWKLNTYF